LVTVIFIDLFVFSNSARVAWGFIEAALSNARTSADTCKFVHGGGDATNLRAKISGRGPAFRSAQPE
jgi:hypothetical protein